MLIPDFWSNYKKHWKKAFPVAAEKLYMFYLAPHNTGAFPVRFLFVTHMHK
jgi:hypothetical protein